MNPNVLDACLFLGGAAGAILRQWLGPGETFTRKTMAQMILMGAVMVIAPNLGFLPAEAKVAAMLAAPFKAAMFALVASAVAGAGVLYATTAVFKRFGNGGKVGLVLLAVAVIPALAGCGALGYVPDSVSLPRDPLLIAYGEARGLVRVGEVLVVQACADQRLDALACRVGADLRTQAVALDGLLQAALVDRRGRLSPQDLQRFLSLGAQLAALAGVPGLGALGGLGVK